jgi:hypothetical protein
MYSNLDFLFEKQTIWQPWTRTFFPLRKMDSKIGREGRGLAMATSGFEPEVVGSNTVCL